MKADRQPSDGQAEALVARVAAVCKRHSIKVERDAKGKPIPSLEWLIALGFLFLKTQPEFQPPKRGRGRPRGTVKGGAKKDYEVIRIATIAAITSGEPVEKVLAKAVKKFEDNGYYAVGDRTTNRKRVARVYKRLDLAQALTEANRRRKAGQ